jgi:hypothetical protein
MNQTPLERLDQYIATLERRTADARRIREILVATPELADALLGTLSPTPIQPPTSISPSTAIMQPVTSTSLDDDDALVNDPLVGGPTAQRYFNQIVGAIRASGNAWKTIEQIMEDTELSRNAVIHVVYKTHKGAFEKTLPPDGGRKKVWRMKTGANEESPQEADAGLAKGGETRQTPALSGGNRLRQLRDFLQQHGPLGRKQIIEQSGIPEGTVGMLLQEELFMRDKDKRWGLRPEKNGVPNTEDGV